MMGLFSREVSDWYKIDGLFACLHNTGALARCLTKGRSKLGTVYV